MAAPPPAWQDPEPLALHTAPVPEYGGGSLADLLPTLLAGQGVPVPGTAAGARPPSSPNSPRPTATASS